MIRKWLIGLLGLMAIAAGVYLACANIRTTLGTGFLVALGLTTVCLAFAKEGYTPHYTVGRLATLGVLFGVVVTISLGAVQALMALAQESPLEVALGGTYLGAGAIAALLLLPERIERKVKGLLVQVIHW